jgi:hypothetical protein
MTVVSDHYYSGHNGVGKPIAGSQQQWRLEVDVLNSDAGGGAESKDI